MKSYFTQTNNVALSHQIMNYFAPAKLPVLSTLAQRFALFNRWFSSIPGPTICNRAFAHYGTSFGELGVNIFYIGKDIQSIYERMIDVGKTAKIYYYDQQSSTMEIVNLLQHQSELFGTFDQFIADCNSNKLPEYSFVEPSYNDHPGPDGGEVLASDQHPTHNVQAGDRFIGVVYNAIRGNDALWESTALLVLYDEHGGTYDHVVPPASGYPSCSLDKNVQVAIVKRQREKTARVAGQGSVGFRFFFSTSMTQGQNQVPFYFQPTLGGGDLNWNPSLSSYQDYRFRAPNVLLLREGFEHSIWGPFGFAFMVDEGKVALTRGQFGSSLWLHSFSTGLTLRAGGFPQVFLLFSWGGNEGTHTIANVNPSLLGGSTRPSWF